ncbi:hypothetical protein BH11PSE2_BH11PSE2_16030 [soil metagenome]
MAGGKIGSGQAALVTGASTGIGVDLAECFAADGYNLILVARSAGPLGEVAERLAKTYGVKTTPITQDLGAIGGGTELAERSARRASASMCWSTTPAMATRAASRARTSMCSWA